MSNQKQLLLLGVLTVQLAFLTYYVAIRGPISFPSTDVGAVRRGMVAPAFDLEKLGGGSVSLEDLRGKIVLINYWATWCEPCLDEMPALEQLHRKFGPRGLAVVAINLNERGDDLKVYMAQNDLTFTVLLGGQRVSQRYGTEKVPESYVLDHRGVVLGKIIGAQDWMSQSSQQYFDGLLPNG